VILLVLAMLFFGVPFTGWLIGNCLLGIWDWFDSFTPHE
jgi:hypothetical protein